MRRTTHHRGGHGRKRKFDVYRHTVSSAIVTSGAGGITANDIMASFKTAYGAEPFQATLSIPRFEVVSTGVGTGTGLNSFTLGYAVAPSTMDAADLDPVANPDIFWWDRKWYVQNNSNPAGVPWAIQGVDFANMKVNTKRTLKTLGDTLFVAVRADYAGFTNMQVTVNTQIGILYA